jgi:hypothetical protein
LGLERCKSHKLDDISGLTQSKKERIKNISDKCGNTAKGEEKE